MKAVNICFVFMISKAPFMTESVYWNVRDKLAAAGAAVNIPECVVKLPLILV
jgi:hypothetical protein